MCWISSSVGSVSVGKYTERNSSEGLAKIACHQYSFFGANIADLRSIVYSISWISMRSFTKALSKSFASIVSFQSSGLM